MPDRVEIGFRNAAIPLFPAGTRVLAAVSGGGDSVALLHLLLRIAPPRRLAVTVAHLDHGLRRRSASDRRFVERMARELGLPAITDRRSVPGLRRKDESPEEAARRVRREFLLEAASACGASRIALGHTLDDQAETVLMRLVRGGGPSSLAGMAAQGPGPFARPLLGFEREELRAYLGRRGIRFLEDPSNESLVHDRNRVRNVVLPLLARSLNPRAARHLVEAAGRLREDAAFLDAEVRAWLGRQAAPRRGGGLSLPADAIGTLEPPLARRAARFALEMAGADGRRISSRHVEALLSLARGRGGSSVDLPGDLRAWTRAGRLLVGPAPRQ